MDVDHGYTRQMSVSYYSYNNSKKPLFCATYRFVPRDFLEDDVGFIGLHTGCHVVCPLGCTSEVGRLGKYNDPKHKVTDALDIKPTSVTSFFGHVLPRAPVSILDEISYGQFHFTVVCV